MTEQRRSLNQWPTVPISEAARAGFDEAAAMRPQPDPAVGAHSTEHSPIPNPLRMVSLREYVAQTVGTLTFAEVLKSRHSGRAYTTPQLQDLAELLTMVFELRGYELADDRGVRRSRAIPSAGGRHPLKPLVLVDDVADLPAGLWRHDPDVDELQLAVADGPDLSPAWDGLLAAGMFDQRPPAIIVLAARFDATLARYPGGAALVWRDAGVALGALHLGATSLKLSSCILGTAGVLSENLLAKCGLAGSLLGDVGAVAVGRAPSP